MVRIAQAEDIQKILDKLSIQQEQLTQLKNSLEAQSTEFKAELERYQKEFTHFQTEIKTSLGIARTLNGGHDHIDSWQDIAGYAQLGGGLFEPNKMCNP